MGELNIFILSLLKVQAINAWEVLQEWGKQGSDT